MLAASSLAKTQKLIFKLRITSIELRTAVWLGQPNLRLHASRHARRVCRATVSSILARVSMTN